jgi:hypothetical protein
LLEAEQEPLQWFLRSPEEDKAIKRMQVAEMKALEPSIEGSEIESIEVSSSNKLKFKTWSFDGTNQHILDLTSGEPEVIEIPTDAVDDLNNRGLFVTDYKAITVASIPIGDGLLRGLEELLEVFQAIPFFPDDWESKARVKKKDSIVPEITEDNKFLSSLEEFESFESILSKIFPAIFERIQFQLIKMGSLKRFLHFETFIIRTPSIIELTKKLIFFNSQYSIIFSRFKKRLILRMMRRFSSLNIQYTGVDPPFFMRISNSIVLEIFQETIFIYN